jgi:hypothetical protein
MYSRKFASLIGEVASSPAQVTLVQLAEMMEIDPGIGVLGRIERVCEQISLLSLELVPDHTKGDIGLVRSLQFKTDRPDIAALSDIRGGERDRVEFKSSLLFDIKRFKHDAGSEPQEYRNDEILFSALKTLAAFANSEGGRLYVGVEDDNTVLGLGFDLRLRETSSLDKWQLFLRSVITDRFKDGAMLNDYVRIDLCALCGKEVARIEVSPRVQLSFLRKKDSHLLFRRQGNRTVQVQITEVEEFLAERQKRRKERASFPA